MEMWRGHSQRMYYRQAYWMLPTYPGLGEREGRWMVWKGFCTWDFADEGKGFHSYAGGSKRYLELAARH